MTRPDRIWAERKTMPGDPAENGYWESRNLYALTMAEYVRRDPAVLAALPEVQAMIAAAYEAAERNLRAYCVSQVFKETLTEQLCSAIGTPADATAALARTVQDAEARGMRRAAAIAIRKRGEGDTPEAILARAAQVEKDAGK